MILFLIYLLSSASKQNSCDIPNCKSCISSKPSIKDLLNSRKPINQPCYQSLGSLKLKINICDHLTPAILCFECNPGYTLRSGLCEAECFDYCKCIEPFKCVTEVDEKTEIFKNCEKLSFDKKNCLKCLEGFYLEEGTCRNLNSFRSARTIFDENSFLIDLTDEKKNREDGNSNVLKNESENLNRNYYKSPGSTNNKYRSASGNVYAAVAGNAASGSSKAASSSSNITDSANTAGGAANAAGGAANAANGSTNAANGSANAANGSANTTSGSANTTSGSANTTNSTNSTNPTNPTIPTTSDNTANSTNPTGPTNETTPTNPAGPTNETNPDSNPGTPQNSSNPSSPNSQNATNTNPSNSSTPNTTKNSSNKDSSPSASISPITLIQILSSVIGSALIFMLIIIFWIVRIRRSKAVKNTAEERPQHLITRISPQPIITQSPPYEATEPLQIYDLNEDDQNKIQQLFPTVVIKSDYAPQTVNFSESLRLNGAPLSSIPKEFDPEYNKRYSQVMKFSQSTPFSYSHLTSGISKVVINEGNFKVNAVIVELDEEGMYLDIDTCVICAQKLTREDTRCLPCKHVFHGNCLFNMMIIEEKKMCPVCKVSYY